jgi:pimeloyl-ACP methyl ester carboxylesterase
MTVLPTELDGVGLYTVVGHGPPVVVLSNPNADPNWWAAPFVSALNQAGYQAVLFVHTGASCEPRDVTRDVISLVEHIGTGPVRLLGWSQGAAIAQEVALARPDLVVAAALLAPYARNNRFQRLLQEAWAALDGADEPLEPVRLALLLLTSFPAQALGDDAAGNLIDGAREWTARRASSSEPRQRSARFIAHYGDRLAALAGVTVPCLVIGFGQDTDTFVARAQEVARAIPKSRYLELPDAGHLTPVTHPRRVVGPVLRFFSEMDGLAGRPMP